MKANKMWLVYALVTTIFWGIWGAFSAIPEKNGFPGTMIYVVWAITMIIPATIALRIIRWKIDLGGKSIFYGLLIGITGAGGQVALLTQALMDGPAHLIFPIISLSPVVTILLSFAFLKERVGKIGLIAIVIAVISLPLLSVTSYNQSSNGGNWLIYALLVFLAWGIQAYFMKVANKTMKAESIFFYMTISGLLFIPVALKFTDFLNHINWHSKWPLFAFLIQILNSLGALTIVYAFKFGKAVIVSPLTNTAAPVITIILSLLIYQTIPNPFVIIGICLGVISTLLFSLEES